MISNNRLDKSFGPVGKWAGVFMFIAGLVESCSSLYGLILVVIGAFVGFTSTSTLLDYDKKRIKFSNNLFGVIRTGKWVPIDPTMKIGIRKSDQTYRAYSRGNQTLDVTQNDFRLIICDSEHKEIMPIKKVGSLDAAKIELEIECKRLGLGRI